MNKHTLYKSHAVVFDPNSYQGLDWSTDFVEKAIEECYDFLPDDWVIYDQYNEDTKIIVVTRKKYADYDNLQPFWYFILKADPIDEYTDEQWIVFDVELHTPNHLYGFQMP